MNIWNSIYAASEELYIFGTLYMQRARNWKWIFESQNHDKFN